MKCLMYQRIICENQLIKNKRLMINSKLPKTKTCLSCKNCANICKHNALSIQLDFLGNSYPLIDSSKCVNCGLCEKVCPVLTYKSVKNQSISYVYACIASEGILKKSSSGGFATLLSEEALDKDMLIVGASFANFPMCNHVFVENKEELDALKGSKYVYSELNDILPQIEKKLKQGKSVLFFGLPCQVAAAKKYLKSAENIYYVDLICHGTCPHFVFNKYIDYLSWRLKSKVIDYNFRGNKEWDGYNVFQNPVAKTVGNISHRLSKWDKWFLTSFLCGRAYNKRCYNCLYIGKQRVGDLTIGDFWGLGKLRPFLKDTKLGVSAVLVNSEKGYFMFNMVRDKLDFCVERTIDEVSKENQTLTSATPIPCNNYLYHLLLRLLPYKLMLPLHFTIYYGEKIIFSMAWRIKSLTKKIFKWKKLE